MLRPAIATLLVLAPAAGATCPTTADLGTGISIFYSDGSQETYVAVRDDLVRMEYAYDGTVEAVMDLALGVFVLSHMEVRNGTPDPSSRLTTSFPGGMGTLPAPAAGDRWARTSVVLDSSGPFEEEVTVAWGVPREVTVGSCTYGEPYYEGITYLPDLGFGFVGWYEDASGRSTYAVTEILAEK